MPDQENRLFATLIRVEIRFAINLSKLSLKSALLSPYFYENPTLHSKKGNHLFSQIRKNDLT